MVAVNGLLNEGTVDGAESYLEQCDFADTSANAPQKEVGLSSIKRWAMYLFFTVIIVCAYAEAVSKQAGLVDILNARKAGTTGEHVHAIVSFPEFVLLFLKLDDFASYPENSQTVCLFGNPNIEPVLQMPLAVEGSAVKCPHPPVELKSRLVTGPVTLRIGKTILASEVNYPNGETWKSLVYEAVTLPEGMLLFVKGLTLFTGNHRTPDTSRLKCRFGVHTWTAVLNACQETILCRFPSTGDHYRSSLIGNAVTLEVLGAALPTVAEYSPEFQLDRWPSSVSALRSTGKFKRPAKVDVRIVTSEKRFMCMCTVVWNGAKFLREWVMYHAHIGVERVFLYDNNSDDQIEEVVADLAAFNVSRHPWPWLKTQEAGFAHCAIRSAPECKWIMFTDVDEFLFPKAFLSNNSHAEKTRTGKSILQRLIADAESTVEQGSKLGQVAIKCLSFGPSGLKELPGSGQAVNYICRLKGVDRHKSIVRPDALLATRCNRIHHFQLDEEKGFVTVQLRKALAIVNHYKYPAWDDFKHKFRRRVSTYVPDWQDKDQLGSRDRVKGLGTEPIEPENWQSDHCQLNDTSLQKYVTETFQDKISGLYPWQLRTEENNSNSKQFNH